MPTYLRYSNDVEKIQPHEAEAVGEILRLMAELRVLAFDKHRHAANGPRVEPRSIDELPD